MVKKHLFIYGSGGFGKEIMELAESINEIEDKWIIEGFIDDNKDRVGKEQNFYKIFDFDMIKEEFSIREVEIVVAIGDPNIKKILVNKVEDEGYRFATLIHPNSIISKNAHIGEGSIIQAGCIITSDVRIDKHVIINISCTIGHDVTINKYCTISPACNISGNVKIGHNVYVGSGTNIRDEINIGKDTIVGIGSVVSKDIPSGVVAYGTPAKVVKSSNGAKIFK